MDNKITKKRINDHMEYDWFKYVIILIVCIFLGYFVFSQINRDRDYETIDFFVSSYAEYSNDYESKAFIEMSGDMEDIYGENVIRNINLNRQDPMGKEYGQLVATQGMQSSDMLILPVNYLKEGASAGYVELTDEILNDYLLPKNVKIDDLTYYEHENTKTGEKTRRGIRVDTFAKMTGAADGVFEMDWKQIAGYKDKEWGENPPPSEFYLVINPKSVSIGKFGTKSEQQNAHALFCIKLFIQFYLK